MSVYHLWQVMMPSIDPTKHMDIHLAFALSLVFLSAMIIKDDKHSGRTCLSQIASICFLIMALVSTAYIFVNFNALLNRAGRYTGMDTIIGFILILAVLEATRRTYGLLLPGLVVISLLYGHFGKYLPGITRTAGRADSQCNDLSVWYFGTVLNVSATYIVLFMILAAANSAVQAVFHRDCPWRRHVPSHRLQMEAGWLGQSTELCNGPPVPSQFL
ncbi:MAG: hypothetical protein ACLUOI_23475 [Eisenbergiella sp.]